MNHKVYVYTTAIPAGKEYSRNQIKTCYDAIDFQDLYTAYKRGHNYLNYDGKHVIHTYNKAVQNKGERRRVYAEILSNVSKYDICIIQGTCSDKRNHDVDALTMYDLLVDYSCSFNSMRGFLGRTWIAAAHIKACIELNKPFIVYSFDPMLDSSFGINRMHSFVESDRTRLMPLMEASVGLSSTKFNKATNTLLYSADLSPYKSKLWFGKLNLHDNIAKQIWQKASFNIATSNGWWAIGEALPFNEPSYFNAMTKHSMTICPPNISNEYVSVKRATDALRNGSLPIFANTGLGHQLHTVWQPLLAEPYYVDSAELYKVENIEPYDKERTFDAIMANLRTIDLDAIFNDYIANWDSFKYEYLPFLKQ